MPASDDLDLDRPATRRDLVELMTLIRALPDQLSVKVDWNASDRGLVYGLDRIQRLALWLMLTSWGAILATLLAVAFRWLR